MKERRVHSAFTVRRCRAHPAQTNVYYSIDSGRWECNVCGDSQAVVALRVGPVDEVRREAVEEAVAALRERAREREEDGLPMQAGYHDAASWLEDWGAPKEPEPCCPDCFGDPR